jgi:hypothetical protein
MAGAALAVSIGLLVVLAMVAESGAARVCNPDALYPCLPAVQAVLQRGEERGQDVHVQPAQGVVVPRPDGAQRPPAAQQVRPHRPARLPLRT